jgi:hypothetical protein
LSLYYGRDHRGLKEPTKDETKVGARPGGLPRYENWGKTPNHPLINPPRALLVLTPRALLMLTPRALLMLTPRALLVLQPRALLMLTPKDVNYKGSLHLIEIRHLLTRMA